MFQTVDEYITNNMSQLTSDMALVLQTFNLKDPSNVPMPTPALFNITLNLLSYEYGEFYLTPQKIKYFLNDLAIYFPRLCQLLSADALVTVDNILRNNYQENIYTAHANQRIDDILDSQEGKNQTNAFGTQKSNSENSREDSTNNINSVLTTDENLVKSDSSGNLNSTTNSTDTSNISNSVGALSTTTSNLQYQFPIQAANNSNFPSIAGTTGNGLVGVPNLTTANANLGTSVFNNQSPQITTSQTNNTGSNIATNVNTDTITTYNEALTNSNSNSNGISKGEYVGMSEQTSTTENIGDTSSIRKAESRNTDSGATGSHRSGFTTTAIFANQLATVIDTLQNTHPPFKWFLDQFSWLGGII